MRSIGNSLGVPNSIGAEFKLPYLLGDAINWELAIKAHHAKDFVNVSYSLGDAIDWKLV